jgi:hypothetical protein
MIMTRALKNDTRAKSTQLRPRKAASEIWSAGLRSADPFAPVSRHLAIHSSELVVALAAPPRAYRRG